MQSVSTHHLYQLSILWLGFSVICRKSSITAEVIESYKALLQIATEDLERLKEEWETARQCMDLCLKADQHLKENVSNYKITPLGTLFNSWHRQTGRFFTVGVES